MTDPVVCLLLRLYDATKKDLCGVRNESVGLHLIADGVTVENLLAGAVQAGAGGALGQGCGVLLFLPLTHNLLAAEPLAHGLLVARSDPLIHLQVKGSGE